MQCKAAYVHPVYLSCISLIKRPNYRPDRILDNRSKIWLEFQISV